MSGPRGEPLSSGWTKKNGEEDRDGMKLRAARCNFDDTGVFRLAGLFRISLEFIVSEDPRFIFRLTWFYWAVREGVCVSLLFIEGWFSCIFYS